MELRNWISLSNKDFEARKYEVPENGKPMLNYYFKAGHGQWYSLADFEYVSEWERLVKKDEMTSKIRDIVDESGSTHIISAQLPKETAIVDWEVCKTALINILTPNNNSIPNSKKRELLVQEIRKILNDDSIQHVVLDIKEDDIRGICRTYQEYCFTPEQKKKCDCFKQFIYLKSALSSEEIPFHSIKEDDVDMFGVAKDKALYLIDLFLKINNSFQINNIQNVSLNIEDLITILSFGSESREKWKKELLSYPESEIEKMTQEKLDWAISYAMDYKNGLSLGKELFTQSNTIGELNHKVDALQKEFPLDYSQSVRILIEYLSGYMDKTGKMPYHDIPSLVVFDTDCLVITDQKTQVLFTERQIKGQYDDDDIIMPIEAAKSFAMQPGIGETIKEAERIEKLSQQQSVENTNPELN